MRVSSPSLLLSVIPGERLRIVTWLLAAFSLLVAAGELHADVGNNYVSALTHVSSPDGLFSTTLNLTNAVPSLSATAPASTNGYSFIGWTTNGSWTNGGGWVRTPTGAAINPITITIYGPTTITANYLPTSQDSEGQGVPDWWKMLYFGRTNLIATSDVQRDGFDLLTKYQRGYDPRQYVILEDGGISRRDSASLNVLLDLNMIFLAQLSDPPGIFSQQLPVTKNSTQSTLAAPLSTNGYSFTGWFDFSGTRLDSADTAGVGSLTVGTVQTTVTARYLPTAQDTNANTVPDWWELFYLNNLTNSADSQPTGDGFSLKTKYQRGYDPRMIQRIVDGGISRRDSAPLNVLLDLNMIFFSEQSDPSGLFSQQVPVNKNSAQSTLAAPLSTNGYSFTGWFDLSGNRIDSPDTAGVGSLTVGNVQTSVTARYLPTAQDTNANGVPDWWELFYLNNLNNSADSQPTGDGFSLKTKYQRGYDPRMIQRIVDGGISRRDSASVNIDLQIFERYAQALLGGTLTDFYSPDPSILSGVNFGTNAAPLPADWNGDGLTDLFVFCGSGVRVFQNTGSEVAPDYIEVSNNFSRLASFLGGNVSPAVAFGDWTGSGHPGLVIGGATGSLSFFPSTGSFSVPIGGAPAFTLDTGSSTTIPAFAKFPGKSGLDLLVMTSDGTVRDYPYTGNPLQPYSSSTANLLGTAVPGATGMTVADANGDGNLDVLVADSTGSIWEFRRDSDGSFALMTKVWGGSGAGFASGLALSAIDPSGSGYPDMIAGTADGKLLYMENPTLGRPSGLRARQGVESVQISWKGDASSRLAGYNVYRADTNSENWTRLNADPLRLPEFRDTTASSGVTSRYRVTTLSYLYLSGNSLPLLFESDPSDPVTASAGKVTISVTNRRVTVGRLVRVILSLSEAKALAGKDLNLKIGYDPAVLRPLSQESDSTPTVIKSALSTGIELSDDSASSRGTITLNGSSGAASAGNGKFVVMTFRMLKQVTSTQVSVLQSSLSSTNGGTVGVETNAAGVITPASTYTEGDINGDGVVDTNDLAVLIDLAQSPRSAPSAEQLQAGDLNGDGAIDEKDVVLLRRQLEGLTAESSPSQNLTNRAISALNGRITIGNQTSVQDVTNPGSPDDYVLSIGNGIVTAGGSLSVPVSISRAAGLSSVMVQVNYDPRLLKYDGISPADLGTQFQPQAKEKNGMVAILLSRSTDLSAGSGKLFDLKFRSPPGAKGGSFSDLVVSRFHVGDSTGVIDLATPLMVMADTNSSVVITPTPTPTPIPTPRPGGIPTPTPIPTSTPPQTGGPDPIPTPTPMETPPQTGGPDPIPGPTPTITPDPTPVPASKAQKQTIAFQSINTKTFGGTPFTLSATAPGGGVTYSSSSPIISINGNQVTILGAGVAWITATQQGGGGYRSAKPVKRKVVISKAPQTITMDDPGSVTYGSDPITLVASSSTGANVVFKSSKPKVASVVNGNSLTIKGGGSCVITASVPASANYLGASTKRTLTVSKASQTIAPFATINPVVLGIVPSIEKPVATSGLPVTLSVSSGLAKYVKGSLVISGPGTVTITASQRGNANYLAAPTVSTSFEVR
jgi:Dockerin type I domain/FG-GAP-like repeat